MVQAGFDSRPRPGQRWPLFTRFFPMLNFYDDPKYIRLTANRLGIPADVFKAMPEEERRALIRHSDSKK